MRTCRCCAARGGVRICGKRIAVGSLSLPLSQLHTGASKPLISCSCSSVFSGDPHPATPARHVSMMSGPLGERNPGGFMTLVNGSFVTNCNATTDEGCLFPNARCYKGMRWTYFTNVSQCACAVDSMLTGPTCSDLMVDAFILDLIPTFIGWALAAHSFVHALRLRRDAKTGSDAIVVVLLNSVLVYCPALVLMEVWTIAINLIPWWSAMSPGAGGGGAWTLLLFLHLLAIMVIPWVIILCAITMQWLRVSRDAVERIRGARRADKWMRMYKGVVVLFALAFGLTCTVVAVLHLPSAGYTAILFLSAICVGFAIAFLRMRSMLSEVHAKVRESSNSSDANLLLNTLKAVIATARLMAVATFILTAWLLAWAVQFSINKGVTLPGAVLRPFAMFKWAVVGSALSVSACVNYLTRVRQYARDYQSSTQGSSSANNRANPLSVPVSPSSIAGGSSYVGMSVMPSKAQSTAVVHSLADAESEAVHAPSSDGE